MQLCNECLDLIGQPATTPPHATLRVIEQSQNDPSKLYKCGACGAILSHHEKAPGGPWSVDSYPADDVGL